MATAWAGVSVRAFPFPLFIDFLLVPAARDQPGLWLDFAESPPKMIGYEALTQCPAPKISRV